jgi:protein involved in polysaccharide export with SLBB domain
MIRSFSGCAVVLVVASSLLVQAQSDTQDPTSYSGVDGQQNSAQQCPDGGYPTPNADGSLGCASISTPGSPTDSRSRVQNRPQSVSGTQENSEIGNQDRNGNLQPRKPLPPEPLTEFQKFVAATTGQLLPIYGASLFRNVPTTFAPSNLTPVGSDYVIGPDDELRVRVWGQVTYSGNLRVDRSGDVYLPEAGTVHVGGLTFAQLDQHLRSALGKVYRNFDLTVDMGRIRSMQVYVTGQARRPGAYTVSSLSSLVDALFASGGPSAQGSLRHIELRRDGKTVVDFDLYALLIHGDKSKDARLLPEDVIFIPPTGPQVAVTGSVHNPGIYELLGTETVGQMLDAAGKTTATASNARVSVERLGDHQVRQAIEFALDTNGLAAPMADGDILHVYAVVPNYQKTVTLRGNVANPGRFAWHAGMHISDLIPDKDSLLSRDYWWKRSHLGLPSPEFEPFLTDFEANQLKRNRRRCTTTTYSDPIGIDGQVTGTSSPNSGDPAGSGTTTVQCQDSDPNNNDQTSQELTSPSAQAELSRGLASSQHAGDASLGTPQQRTNSTMGSTSLGSELRDSPITGGAPFAKRTDVRISSGEIDWDYAVIERFNSETLKTSLVPFDLGKLVLEHDASQNLTIEPGDTITIFSQGDIRVPLDRQTKYVHLEGEFVHSGIYSVAPGETLRDLVRRAGGFTSRAYLYGSEFDRESTRVLQQERIDEYVRRVDLDAERGNLALTAAPSSSAGTLASATAATAAEQQLISRLKQLRATGRVVLNFRPGSAGLDDVPEIPLENDDRFTVPSTPSTVNIVGAVYDQNSFLFQNGGSAGHYLLLAGGPDRNADFHRTFVIRADGSVISRDAVKGPWGNTFKTLRLNPGDTIVVPDKTIRPTALRGLLDWTQIFSQLAIGAAAVNILR